MIQFFNKNGSGSTILELLNNISNDLWLIAARLITHAEKQGVSTLSGKCAQHTCRKQGTHFHCSIYWNPFHHTNMMTLKHVHVAHLQWAVTKLKKGKRSWNAPGHVICLWFLISSGVHHCAYTIGNELQSSYTCLQHERCVAVCQVVLPDLTQDSYSLGNVEMFLTGWLGHHNWSDWKAFRVFCVQVVVPLKVSLSPVVKMLR